MYWWGIFGESILKQKLVIQYKIKIRIYYKLQAIELCLLDETQCSNENNTVLILPNKFKINK